MITAAFIIVMVMFVVGSIAGIVSIERGRPVDDHDDKYDMNWY